MYPNKKEPIIQVKQEQQRGWNAVSSSSRSGNCCWCRKPTLNTISVLGGASDVRVVYFCDDKCVEKFKDSVKKW